MAAAPLSLPRLIQGSRRAGLLVLLAVTLAEVSTHMLAAGLLKALLTGYLPQRVAGSALLLAGLLAVWARWARDVRAERIGLDYANDVRVALGSHALAVAGRAGRGRFGTLAVRMTGDLSALKDWVSQGVCGGLAGLAALAGAVAAAALTTGWPGLVAAMAAPLLALIMGLVLLRPLLRSITRLRRLRGRLSAAVGDMIFAAPSISRYGTERAALKSLNRRGDALMREQVHLARLSAWLHVPAGLCIPLGAAIAVGLMQAGLDPLGLGGAAGWAALLFSLSLATLSLSQLARALVHTLERHVAARRLDALLREAARMAPLGPRGETRLPPGPGLSLSVDGVVLVPAGGQVRLARRLAEPLLGDILDASPGVSVDGLAAASIWHQDWARRIAYCGPLVPLGRGRLSRVLGARRSLDAETLARVLALSGLPVGWSESDPLIDPFSGQLNESILARLRLARALAHRPRLLILDDAWLDADPALSGRIADWSHRWGVSLLQLIPDTDRSDDDATLPTLAH
jgi:ABC-type multidrug transport system fused ATPase/permease subunit